MDLFEPNTCAGVIHSSLNKLIAGSENFHLGDTAVFYRQHFSGAITFTIIHIRDMWLSTSPFVNDRAFSDE